MRAAIVRIIDVLKRLQASEETDQSGAIEALESQIGSLSENISDLETIVENLDGETPQKRYERLLASSVQELTGSLAQMAMDAVEREEQAAAATIAALLRESNRRTEIRLEQSVRITETSRMATQILLLQTNLNEFSASVSEEFLAFTGELSEVQGSVTSIASALTTVSTTVAGNTSSISELLSSVDGISAEWTVALTEQGYVNGLVQLSGADSKSTFTVVADKIQFAQPGETGGAPRVLVGIGNISGTPSIGIKGDALVDGAVLARTIAAGSVTADKINVTNLKAISSEFQDMTCSGQQISANGKMMIDWSGNTWTVIA